MEIFLSNSFASCCNPVYFVCLVGSPCLVRLPRGAALWKGWKEFHGKAWCAMEGLDHSLVPNGGVPVLPLIVLKIEMAVASFKRGKDCQLQELPLLREGS